MTCYKKSDILRFAAYYDNYPNDEVKLYGTVITDMLPTLNAIDAIPRREAIRIVNSLMREGSPHNATLREAGQLLREWEEAEHADQ